MREDFLHFIWQHQRFTTFQGWKTTTGETIEILKWGDLNTNEGADFQNAQIRIGTWLWAGAVEMHVKSSDWLLHQHNEHRHYDNVILHVVAEVDTPIYRNNGELLPCLHIKPYVPEGLYARYWHLKNTQSWIPCEKMIASHWKNGYFNDLLLERLMTKSETIAQVLKENMGDWENTFWQFLARTMGGKINNEAMLRLAQVTPFKVLARHADQIGQIESLIFGQAGLLKNATFEEEYPLFLQKEYHFLAQKFSLSPIPKHLWQFLRLRPANFPTLRLAQLAQLVHRYPRGLFAQILKIEDIEPLKEMFEDLTVSDYWLSHYTFEAISESKKKTKKVGEDMIHSLIINVIAPFLYLYASLRHSLKHKECALSFLQKLPAESNQIIQKWENIGVFTQNAAQSQALLTLKKEYCDRKRCLECRVGVEILR